MNVEFRINRILQHQKDQNEGRPSDFLKGIVSGGAGTPADLLKAAITFGAMSQLNLMGRKTSLSDLPDLKIPLTSDYIGNLLGANVQSKAFNAGTIGSPDITDLLKVAPHLAMTLFHGSPHRFERFDLSKLGTGEGAQSYGSGLYFAENPGVANSYKQQLSFGSGNTSRDAAARMLESAGGDYERALQIANSRLNDALTRGASPAAYQDLLSAKRHLLNKEPLSGHLYEVEIPDDIAGRMLDWDAPLSSQPQSVRNALGKKFPDSATGADIYRSLAKEMGPQKASEQLNALGVPGVRYLDAGSRAEGAGSRNMVLFDQNAITSVKRNGDLVFENRLGLQ